MTLRECKAERGVGMGTEIAEVHNQSVCNTSTPQGDLGSNSNSNFHNVANNSRMSVSLASVPHHMTHKVAKYREQNSLDTVARCRPTQHHTLP